MSSQEFFEQEHCDRCYGDLTARTLSWFNQETICGTCSRWEEAIILAQDESKSELEGIGRIPEVDFEVNWGEKPPKRLFDK